mgnify:CR=1 FL=1
MLLALLATTSLWLRHAFPVFALGPVLHDDALFVELANHLCDGNWLGPYDNLTLAKAKNVVALSRLLLERHGGQVPADRAALEALPGVGRKTANVVLNVAFGQETMAVDTHIFRLGNRTGLAPGKTTRAVEDGLVKRCPPEMLRDAHHWLILHGRYVCKARAPECWRCVALSHCNYSRKMLVPPG